MLKTLSRSVVIMFLFDLIILCLSTCYWANIFDYTPKAVVILCCLIVPIGLIILYLKCNYKIREHNINFKNSYLLFEGIVMTHVLPVLYLVIFAASVTDTLKFIATNILTIFVLLELYRIFYHLYLFKLKKVKNILILAAMIILTVTLPITGFTALRVWLTDHENPIYTQPRVGMDGKVFKCYKLRTMYANDYVPNAICLHFSGIKSAM